MPLNGSENCCDRPTRWPWLPNRGRCPSWCRLAQEPPAKLATITTEPEPTSSSPAGATSVPFMAVLTGPVRITTDNITMAATCTITVSRGDDSARSGFASRWSAQTFQTLEPDSAQSVLVPTSSGLLAICWQLASQRGPRKAFVLVGVTGFEPVASAV